ncbi:MAG: hypothetical protein H6842_01375 [Rhodospirillaceae bacterium]|nr:hypothetical protein [Rhodospirillaceae bacterium]
MRYRRLLASAILGVGLAPVAAHGQATPDGAAALQIDLKRLVAGWLRPVSGIVDVLFDSGITVTAEGDRYRVDVPRLEIVNADIARVRMGDVHFTMQPTGPGQYGLAGTGPIRSDTRTPDGTVVGWASIAASDWTAELDLNTGWLTGYAFRGQDYFEGFFDGGSRSIDVVESSIGYEPMGQGFARIAGDLTYQGFESIDVAFDVHQTIGTIRAEWAFAGVNPAAVIRLIGAMPELAGPLSPSSEDWESFLDAVRQALGDAPALFDSADFRYLVEDTWVDAPGERVEVGVIDGGCALSGFAAAISDADCDLAMRDLAFAPMPFEAYEFVPSDIRIDASVARLPRVAIIDAIALALEERTLLGEEQAAAVAGEAIALAMAAAQSEITLRDFSMAAPAYTIAVQGSVRMAPQSPVGIAAEAVVTLGRVEELRRLVAGAAQSDADVRMLNIMLAFGIQDVDADNNPVVRFELELTEAGTATVNEVDLGPL